MAMLPGTAHDERSALVQPLIDQLVAGQSESLYVLSSAAAALRTRADELVQAMSEELRAGGDQAVQRLEAASAQLTARTAEQLEQITRVGATFVHDALAAAQAVTLAGENLIARLVEVLDERDRRDQLLEDRLTARVERLTKKTEASVTRLSGELADETDLIRMREAATEATAVAQLEQVLDRLLSAPRAELKKLRKTHQSDEDGR
jgi:hypothetical protein